MLSIGVTGHRYLPEIDRLEAGIDQALARIEQQSSEASWCVVSSLAEGADRLVVRRILLRHPSASLVVPLPLPVEEYQHDFGSEASRQEFLELLQMSQEIIPPEPQLTREEGYRQAGLVMLDRANLLITLWDGLVERGLGGTGEIVSLARERKMPVAWVFCQAVLPAEVDRWSKVQGELTWENF